VYFVPPLTGFPLELRIDAWSQKNQNDGAIRWSKKFCDRFSRLDTILACDRQTVRQTSYDSKDCPMQYVIVIHR